jgi:translation initiation factor RLI1
MNQIMATYLADRVIVFEGKPAVESYARTPEGLLTGMNKFLKSLDITFRRDPTNLYVPLYPCPRHSLRYMIKHGTLTI